MKDKVYINGVGCISAQETGDGFLENAVALSGETVVSSQAPSYKDYISPGAIRRMGKGVKNGIVASAMAMADANSPELDAIITGTGMGCIEDSEKFLKAIIDSDEQFLTPTSFIQSTHNTVGGQIALGLQCKSYNFTYVNGGSSFESALLDAKMQIETGESQSILIGGVDECGTYTREFFKVAGLVKSEVDNDTLLESKTPGFVYGEGATFFVLENKKSANTYAQVADVKLVNSIEKQHVFEHAVEFLRGNDMTIQDLDAVILGLDGDARYDGFYDAFRSEIFEMTPQLYYKHLTAEYHTASAFGLWMAAKILQTQSIPDIIRVNLAHKPVIRTILLYNQLCGKDHSFTLVKHADS
ncbi:MAG: beta-ketoacyl synthase chain length factor [Flavobacterium sp.]|nr:beta-ketoacyl synthase chain length factor [Flavobacterium sp.]